MWFFNNTFISSIWLFSFITSASLFVEFPGLDDLFELESISLISLGGLEKWNKKSFHIYYIVRTWWCSRGWSYCFAVVTETNGTAISWIPFWKQSFTYCLDRRFTESMLTGCLSGDPDIFHVWEKGWRLAYLMTFDRCWFFEVWNKTLNFTFIADSLFDRFVLSRIVAVARRWTIQVAWRIAARRRWVWSIIRRSGWFLLMVVTMICPMSISWTRISTFWWS